MEADDGSDDPTPELVVVDDENEDETNLKRVLRLNWVRILFLCQTELITSHSEHLSRDWTSPIYIFKKDIQVEHADGCHFHEFQCTAGKCRGKNGQSVRRFLDTSDAKSMSGLCQHAKKC